MVPRSIRSRGTASFLQETVAPSASPARRVARKGGVILAEKASILVRAWRLVRWPPEVPETDLPAHVQSSIRRQVNHRMILSLRAWLGFVAGFGGAVAACVAISHWTHIWFPTQDGSLLFGCLMLSPTFFLFLIACGVIIKPTFMRIRREVWHSHGLCPECGYDARETPCRCPECGAAPIPPNV
jgi:hypothetical protein